MDDDCDLYAEATIDAVSECFSELNTALRAALAADKAFLPAVLLPLCRHRSLAIAGTAEAALLGLLSNCEAMGATRHSWSGVQGPACMQGQLVWSHVRTAARSKMRHIQALTIRVRVKIRHIQALTALRYLLRSAPAWRHHNEHCMAVQVHAQRIAARFHEVSSTLLPSLLLLPRWALSHPSALHAGASGFGVRWADH